MKNLIKYLITFFSKKSNIATIQNEEAINYKLQALNIFDKIGHNNFYGISFDKARKKFVVRYKTQDRIYFVGRFATLNRAKKAYIEYALRNNLEIKIKPAKNN